MKNKITFAALLFSVLLLFSCKENEKYSKVEKKTNQKVPKTHKIQIIESLKAIIN